MRPHLYIARLIIKSHTSQLRILSDLLPYNNNNNNNISRSHFHSAAAVWRSTILQDSKSIPRAIQSLETALTVNNIQVRQGAIQELLNQRNWIYPSERIENLLEKLTEDQLYSIFNSKHHLYSSQQLFEFLGHMRKKVAVVYGHKAQGKTQFLYFVFRLLQVMGEKVIFLDKSMLPLEADHNVDISSVNFCGNWWKNSFINIGGPVTDMLTTVYWPCIHFPGLLK